MSSEGVERFSFFRSQINNRRFCRETILILESLLVCEDVKSSIQLRSRLREFLRFESISVIREIAQKTVEQKLVVLEFFVLVFAIIGDIESCLALRYEALVMRNLKSTSCKWLQVSCMEWLNFAEQSLENGFYYVAIKACENAQPRMQMHDTANLKTDEILEYAQVNEKTKRLKDYAVELVASLSVSVQAQAAEYLKKKTIEKSTRRSPYCKEKKFVASTLYRNGIKRRNVQKLHELQGLD